MLWVLVFVVFATMVYRGSSRRSLTIAAALCIAGGLYVTIVVQNYAASSGAQYYEPAVALPISAAVSAGILGLAALTGYSLRRLFRKT